jgi:16S rRNA (cytidine1402-2'-O)-methyltransferase
MTDRGEGVLYTVATPIGNLEDVSQRALRVLGEVDWIAAEDTRRTRKLLSRFEIRAARVLSCFVANESRRAAELAARLRRGEKGALVTEAGTPGIADPGAKIVRAALEAGARVVPVPGPSAVTAALSASGFSADRFSFLGFLPTRGRDRSATLRWIAETPHALVLYESPRRVAKSLADLAAQAPDRACAVFRELTKLHEEAHRGTIAELADLPQLAAPRGELVIVLGPASRTPPQLEDGAVKAALSRRLGAGAALAEAAREVARELGVPRTRVYRMGIEMRRKGRRS